MKYQYWWLLSYILLANLGQSLLPNRKFDAPVNVVDITQSPDGRIVAAYNVSHIMVYHAYTGAVSQIIQPVSRITSITFSQYSNLLGFAQSNGIVEIYRVFQQKGQLQLLKSQTKIVRQGNSIDIYPISCCFVAGDEIVSIYSDGMIMSWKPFSDQLILMGSFQQTGSPKLACSPLDSPEFAIIGAVQTTTSHSESAQEEEAKMSKSGNSSVVLSVHIINQSSLLIEEKVQIVDNNIEYANYIAYDGIGYYIYVAGNDNRIGRYNALTYNYQIFYATQGEGQLYKLAFPFDSLLFAVINASHLIYVSNFTGSGKQQVMSKVEVYLSDSKTFSMSSSRLFLLEGNGINAMDNCEEGWFYEDGQCYPCAYECLLCSSTKYTCHKCIDIYFYLEQPQCLKCITGCLICLNGISCEACENTFALAENNTCVCPPNEVIQNNLCVCPSGYHISDSSCLKDQGVKFWIISIVVGSAVLSLLLITVVSIVVMRKKDSTRKNLLLQDENL